MGALKKKRHEDFARGLADGLNQREAYERAGYSGKASASAASHLVNRNPCILARADELRQIYAEAEKNAAPLRAGKPELTRQWVIEQLRTIAERCLQAQPVTDRTGALTGEYKFDAANARGALQLLGQDLGMFVERKEVGSPGAFATVEERRAAENRLKLKMVRLGMAKPLRLVGSGSAVPVENSTDNATEAQQVSESRQSEQSVEISTPEVEAPDQTGEPEPEAPSTLAERDLAPLPPGILEPIKDQPDPASVERLKPAPGVAVCAIPGWGHRPPEPAIPKPPLQPLVDPGPGPDRAAYRDELRRRQNLDVRYGTPNTCDRHGHPLK